MIKQLFIAEGTKRKRDRKKMESFYYEAIYSILKDENLRKTKTTQMKEFTEHMKEKYDSKQVDADQIQRIGNTLHKKVPETANSSLDEIVPMEELRSAIQNGRRCNQSRILQRNMGHNKT
jgi:hypothetical protein